MTIDSYVPMSAPGQRNTEPFLRVGRGEGCGLPLCDCSDGFWLSISDGTAGIKVRFDSLEEMTMILNRRF